MNEVMTIEKAVEIYGLGYVAFDKFVYTSSIYPSEWYWIAS